MAIDLSDYDVRHLSYHLIAAGRTPDLFALLETRVSSRPVWYDISVAADPSGAAFVGDIDRAWVESERIIRSSDAHAAVDDVIRELGYGLAVATVRGQTSRLPADVVSALVQAGMWSQEAAAAAAFTSSPPAFEILIAIAPMLSPAQAGAAAERLRGASGALDEYDSYKCGRALAALSGRLSGPEQIVNQHAAISVVEAVPLRTDGWSNARNRSAAIVALAPHVSGSAHVRVMRVLLALLLGKWVGLDEVVVFARHVTDLSDRALSKAMRAVERIPDEDLRSLLFVALARRATGPERIALVRSALRTKEWPEFRAAECMFRNLHELLKLLELPLRAELLERAVSHVPSAGSRDRRSALALLAPFAAPQLRRTLLHEALKVPERAWLSEEWAQLASAVAILASSENAADLLSAAQKIPAGLSRTEALASLLPYLSGEMHEEVIAEVGLAARESGNSSWLLAVADASPAHHRRAILVEALAVSQRINDEDCRIAGSATLAAGLVDSERDAVVEQLWRSAQALPHGLRRARCVRLLAPTLPAEHLDEALALAQAVRERVPRNAAIVALAQRLVVCGRSVEAIDLGRTVDADDERAESLAGDDDEVEWSHGLYGVVKSAVAASNTAAAAAALQSIAGRHRPDSAVFGAAIESPDLARTWLPLLDDLDHRSRHITLSYVSRLAPRSAVDEMVLYVVKRVDDPDYIETLCAIVKSMPDAERAGRLKELLEILMRTADRRQAYASTVVSDGQPRGLDDTRGVSDDLLGRAASLHRRVVGPEQPSKEWAAFDKLLHSLPAVDGAANDIESCVADRARQEITKARSLSGETSQAQSVIELAATVPDAVLGDVLEFALRLSDADSRNAVLRALAKRASDTPRQVLYELWSRALHLLSQRSRGALFEGAGALSPIAARLGGSAVLTTTLELFRETRQSWP